MLPAGKDSKTISKALGLQWSPIENLWKEWPSYWNYSKSDEWLTQKEELRTTSKDLHLPELRSELMIQQ